VHRAFALARCSAFGGRAQAKSTRIEMESERSSDKSQSARGMVGDLPDTEVPW
jgi:hypothetical protein